LFPRLRRAIDEIAANASIGVRADRARSWPTPGAIAEARRFAPSTYEDTFRWDALQVVAGWWRRCSSLPRPRTACSRTPGRSSRTTPLDAAVT
jgi:hypothetical protein